MKAPLTGTALTANGNSCANIQMVSPTGTTNVTFKATPTGGSGYYEYDWDFNNDGTIDATTTSADPVFDSSITYPYSIPSGQDTATFTARVTIIDTAACAGQSTTKTITFTLFRPLALTGTTPAWQQTCGTQTVAFDFTGTFAGGIAPYHDYLWNFGDGSSTVTQTPMVSHTYAAGGDYTVQMTVTDSAVPNCGDPPNTLNVIANISVVDAIMTTPITNDLPAAYNNHFVAPRTIHFMENATGGSNGLTYTWSVAPAGPSIASPAASETDIDFPAVTVPTTYTVSVTVADSLVPNAYCVETMSVTAYPPLDCSAFSVVPTSTSDLLPLDDTFTTTWTGGAPNYTLTYTFTRTKDADGNPVADTPIIDTVPALNGSPYLETYTFEKSGTWVVDINIADAEGNTCDKSITVQVLEPPALTVTTTTLINGVLGTSGLAPLTVNFSSVPQGGVAPYTFHWNFDDGTSSTEQNPIHTYTSQGSYHVTLTVTDSYPAAGGGPHTATASVDITVYPPLTVTATATPTSVTTADGTVNFSASATGGDGNYTYAWTFGDGATGTGQSVSHQYATPGTYYAYVMVTDTHTDTAQSSQQPIHVYAPVTLSASGSPNPATLDSTGQVSVNFTASASGGSGNFKYDWTFGDGSTGTGATVTHIYTGPGTMHVSVTATDLSDTYTGSVQSKSFDVTIKPNPPVITAAVKVGNPFRIKLYGSNFQPNCAVTINGVPVDYKYKNSGKLKLKHCKSLCPKGVPVAIVVTNPDGGVSNTFMFSR